jgi:hypothetical protein
MAGGRSPTSDERTWWSRERQATRSRPSCALAAHSETVRAGAKMPVRKQRQVSAKAAYYYSTPIAVTPA